MRRRSLNAIARSKSNATFWTCPRGCSTIARDFWSSFAETEALLGRITQNRTDLVLLKRDLHTLKGNSAIFRSVAHLGSVPRSRIEARGLRRPNRRLLADRPAVAAHLLANSSTLGKRPQNGIEIDEREYLAVLDAVRRGVDKGLLERMVNAWRLEPVRTRLERAGEQLSATATRLGKGAVQVVVHSPHVYLARDELTEF